MVYRFGQFELNVGEFQLLQDGRLVALEPKALNLLIYLLENRNRLVRKQELLDRVWHDALVTENALTRAVGLLRKALQEDSRVPRFIETVPTAGYRFIGAVDTEIDTPVATPPAERRRVPKWVFAVAAVALLSLGVGLFTRYPRRVQALSGKDTIILADFANSTGDPVFDETLRQGLAVQLEQSPFLSLVSDDRIQRVLSLMGRAADTRLTPDVAREVCERTASAVVLEGSIASLGSQYVLGLRAKECRDQTVLAEEQMQAAKKEDVLNALSQMAGGVRQKLGESLSSVERFDTPLPEVTTSSLEALQAFDLGIKKGQKGEFVAALPFFQRATQIDPNFAIGYAALGSQYSNMDESILAGEYLRKAYELRTHVSEMEKLVIEATYYLDVTGDLQKARQTYELAAQTYPRNFKFRTSLWLLGSQTGQLDDALAQIRECVRIDPTDPANYGQLVAAYTYLNRFDEAQSEAQRDLQKGLDSFPLRIQLYRLAFLSNDAKGMAEHVAWAVGRPGIEDELLEQEADTAAYFGKLEKSRELSRQSIASAIRADKKQKSLVFEAKGALSEALLGNAQEARSRARSRAGLALPREAQYATALSLAVAGDTSRAQILADDLARRRPEDTLVQFHYLPTIRAQIAINQGQPAKAIEMLQGSVPYEYAAITVPLYMAPVYVRGNAYLAAHQGTAAAAEFQKILNHRGIVRNHLVGALAHLQLGRAYAMTGDSQKARSAYQDFFSLWKEADPGIPVLKQAKSEYAKLQG